MELCPSVGASKLRQRARQSSADIVRAVLKVPLRRAAGIIAALLAGVLAACATPAQRFEQRAAALGFASINLSGAGYLHRAYTTGLESGADALHVYVEHDGTPWLDLKYVSQDPTPRTPFALELMARDAGPRLFLGRPCYFEPMYESGCGPLLWTHRRYSPEVVASMVAALREFLAMHYYGRVLLIGYSGGGTLAWLTARQMPEAVAVITVAANLDTDRWARMHGYSPLDGSLNPAQLPTLPPPIVEIHYVGGRDRNVPPAVAESFARRHQRAQIVVVEDFDHECCWMARWPELLANALASQPTAPRQSD